MSDLHQMSPTDAVTPFVGAPALRCQWCSVPLANGVTICPTCGSPGIPDPRMMVVGLSEPEVDQASPPEGTVETNGIVGGEAGLVTWRRKDAAAGVSDASPIQVMDFEEVERRRMQSIGFIAVSVIICALLGWTIGPTLLEGPFENLTGAAVDNPSDLRSMGTVIGLISGMFVGATGGWVIWSSR